MQVKCRGQCQYQCRPGADLGVKPIVTGYGQRVLSSDIDAGVLNVQHIKAP